MKKLFVLILFTSTLFAQKKFQQGFYINDSGEKISGLIASNKTINTPTEFSFKINNDAEVISLNTNNTKQIVLTEENTIFERFTVTYDKESVNYADPLQRINANIEAETKTLFLKKLVDGEVSLYQLIINDFKSYYIKKKNEENVMLLEYKKIYTDGRIKDMTNYRKQLSENLLCNKLTLKNYLALEYKENSLKKIIDKNNNCDSVFFNYDTIKHKTKIILTPYIDYTFNSFRYENLGINENKINRQNVNLGIEFSVLLSDINKKFETFFRFNYAKYDFNHPTNSIEYEGFTEYYTTQFEPTILSPEIGVRYNIISRLNHKIYSNFSLGYSFTNDGVKLSVTKKYEESLNLPDENTITNFKTFGDRFIQLGLGYDYDWRYGFEIKYNLISKNYLDTRINSFQTDHSFISLSFRYSIMKPKFKK